MKKTTLLGLLLFICLQGRAQKEALEEAEFYPQGGFYKQAVDVQIFAPDATVYYTLDGTTPSRKASIYKGTLHIYTTTIVRAVAYRNGKPGKLLAQTYFVKEPETTFPVISIGVTPDILFDPVNGMFMQGNELKDTTWKMPGANFWTTQEVPVHIEIYETDGRCVYNSLSGFRLFGGMSRLFPQKSMTLVARESYGAKHFDYPIFGKGGLKDFKFLVLRNSGSDWGKTEFRDALMTSLVKDWDLDVQDYRPAHVYINGIYWGIYNIREKINRYYIADHHKGVDKDSIDFLEHNILRRRGSSNHYRYMLNFISQNTLRDPENYAFVQTMMDVDNFMNYEIAQIYFDNQDAGGNIKYWRPRTRDGRWRWILYDTDWGFGLQERQAYKNNSLAFHTEPNGPEWPNPPWSTFLLRNLLENPEFEHQFINRFADHLNTTFNPVRVAHKIDEMYQTLLPEMPRQLLRWRLSKGDWDASVDVLRTFAQERPYYTRLHLMDYFNTGGLRTLQLSVEGGGALLLNDNIHVDGSEAFEGTYFEKIPVSIKIVPHHGYRFVRWEGINAPEGMQELTLALHDKVTTIKAIFEKYEHPLEGKVVINEISANNHQSGDWLEIFNGSKETVNMRGWILTDFKHEFVFPNADIPPNDYLVVSKNMRRFYSAFPKAYNVIGGLSFGLNKRREKVELFAANGAMVDSVLYDLPHSDSIFTLSLLLPSMDNSDPGNWEMRYGKGSPNAPNPYFLESRIRSTQKEWMEIGMSASVVMLCIVLLILRHRRIL